MPVAASDAVLLREAAEVSDWPGDALSAADDRDEAETDWAVLEENAREAVAGALRDAPPAVLGVGVLLELGDAATLLEANEVYVEAL